VGAVRAAASAIVLAAVLGQASRGLSAQHQHAEAATSALARSPDSIRGPSPSSSSFPTPAFDESGRLFVAFVEGGFVYVSSSDDRGRTFDRAVAVNPEPEKIDANGEGRPKIAVARDGTLLVTWTQKLDKPYSGLIRFSRSTDGGRSFARPVTINDDGLVTGHRFDALAVAPSGEVLVAWIDKRDLERALEKGAPYAGAAIYLAVSRDGGRSFEANRKIKDHVCECCRLSFAFDAKGSPSLLFRDILEAGIRDHALATGLLEKGGPRWRRVTFDDWKIDACPHHGPALSIDDDLHHIVWFTAGERSGTGAFYARSTDGGRTFGPPVALGDDERASHPFVLAAGRGNVYLVWMEGDGTSSQIRLQVSDDGGVSWSTPVTVARGSAGADHPLLVHHGEEIFLSWFTKDAGYRLLPVSSEAGS
jgi:hypothetical protein